MLALGSWVTMACSARPAAQGAPAPGPTASLPDDEGAAALAPERTCPSDAPWNGSVCAGAGYVACPGGMRLEGDACAAPPTVDAPKTAPRGPRTARAARSSEPRVAGDDSTGVPECDRFLRTYEQCVLAKVSGGGGPSTIDGIRSAYRQLAKDPKQRATLAAQCTNVMRTLKSTCP